MGMLSKIVNKFKVKQIKEIPEWQSSVRSIVSEVHKIDYKPLKSLKEAKKYDDAYLVMEGDWGGTIYLSIPVRNVKCGDKELKRLLKDLDKIGWACNEGDGAGMYYERMKIGQCIMGGMGGGIATNSLWVHQKSPITKYQDKIRKVFNGDVNSIHKRDNSDFNKK